MSPKSKKLTFLDHLKELRVRLIRASAAVIIVFISLVYFSNDIYLFVADPLQALLFNDSFMIATEVASPFLSPLKLTFYVSVGLLIYYLSVMPIYIYQSYVQTSSEYREIYNVILKSLNFFLYSMFTIGFIVQYYWRKKSMMGKM